LATVGEGTLWLRRWGRPSHRGGGCRQEQGCCFFRSRTSHIEAPLLLHHLRGLKDELTGQISSAPTDAATHLRFPPSDHREQPQEPPEAGRTPRQQEPHVHHAIIHMGKTQRPRLARRRLNWSSQEEGEKREREGGKLLEIPIYTQRVVHPDPSTAACRHGSS
jgi:hypothetical protein